MMLRRPRHRVLLGLILFLCLAGAWTSDGLLALHDALGPAGTSERGLLDKLCRSISTGVSGCESNSQSAWSQIPLPLLGPDHELPVAFVGLWYFLSLGIWFAFTGGAPSAVVKKAEWQTDEPPPASRRRWVPLIVSMAGGYASLFLLGLMLFGRVPWCPACVATHLINFLLIGAIWTLYTSAPASKESPQFTGIPASIAALVTAILLCLLLLMDRRQQLMLRGERNALIPFRDEVLSMQGDQRLLMGMYLSEPRLSITRRAGETPPTDRHQLVVFTDYECPACYANDQTLKNEVEKDFGAGLIVSLRHYPLCRDCNDRVQTNIHPNACMAAYAAEAARLLGGQSAFDRMSDLLFANRLRLGENIYSELATQAGIDPIAFHQKMNDKAVRQVVADDIAAAAELDVRNTPTMFLDGRQVPQLCICPTFWKAAATLRVNPNDETRNQNQ